MAAVEESGIRRDCIEITKDILVPHHQAAMSQFHGEKISDPPADRDQ
jgi:hypothetical protein